MCGGPGRNIGNFLFPLLVQVGSLSTPVKEPVILNYIPCPNCSSSVAPGNSWCPVCGIALRPQPCAFCRQILEPKDKHCQYCGAPRGLAKNW
ncbi:MAG: hypothetical protein CVU39_07325 [Chloroflexi bacterium HGW-Chloroflexi-10]|nr:MAG: hypothetical protein CVU39_07325 [Chloroflexi bacterium HGW-Chloroflexi-10]